MLRAPALIRTRTCAGGRPSRVSWIHEPCGLTAENSLAEGVVEEGVLHIELLNWPVAGDSNSEHHANDGQFHNRAKSLVVVDPEVLSETSKDPASLIVIKGPIGAKLVREDPLVGDDIGATGPRESPRSHCSSEPRIRPQQPRTNWGRQAQHVQRSRSGMVSMETSRQ
jgi:hypothetical protein